MCYILNRCLLDRHYDLKIYVYNTMNLFFKLYFSVYLLPTAHIDPDVCGVEFANSLARLQEAETV